MAKTISPSEPVTGGQIGKIGDLLAAQLRKNEKELPMEAVQLVIRNQGGPLGQKLLAVVREFVDAVSNLIIRVVKVNRTRTSQEALKATGRKLYLNDEVVAEMPRGEGEEIEAVFFHLGQVVSNNDLEKEYELRGLDQIDPVSLAAVNEADPLFADKYPNATQWKDKNGKWCYAIFYRSDDERRAHVFQFGDGWGGSWWFGGVRKKSAQALEPVVS